MGGSKVNAHNRRLASQRPRPPQRQTKTDKTKPRIRKIEQIDQRDQPDEMTAHPVQMIEIERSLAKDDHPDLKQPRNEPAPGRQHQEWKSLGRCATRS